MNVNRHVTLLVDVLAMLLYRMTQKKLELLKNPTKIEEIQEKKFIDRN